MDAFADLISVASEKVSPYCNGRNTEVRKDWFINDIQYALT